MSDPTVPASHLLLLKVGTFTVQLPEDSGNVAVSKKPPREFKIRIRKAGQLRTREINNFLQDKPHDESVRFTGILLLPLPTKLATISAGRFSC